MVEGAALEKQCTGNRIEGSNPSLSAKKVVDYFVFIVYLRLLDKRAE